MKFSQVVDWGLQPESTGWLQGHGRGPPPYWSKQRPRGARAVRERCGNRCCRGTSRQVELSERCTQLTEPKRSQLPAAVREQVIPSAALSSDDTNKPKALALSATCPTKKPTAQPRGGYEMDLDLLCGSDAHARALQFPVGDRHVPAQPQIEKKSVGVHTSNFVREATFITSS